MAPSTTAPNARPATLSTLPPNMVTTAAVLTDEMAPKTGSYTALLTTTTDAVTTTAGAAANNTNDMMHIDTATAALETSQPLLFTYSHEEVQQLLEDTRLEGWQARFEEGHRTGRKMGQEEG